LINAEFPFDGSCFSHVVEAVGESLNCWLYALLCILNTQLGFLVRLLITRRAVLRAISSRWLICYWSSEQGKSGCYRVQQCKAATALFTSFSVNVSPAAYTREDVQPALRAQGRSQTWVSATTFPQIHFQPVLHENTWLIGSHGEHNRHMSHW
jgi:hypothetical protein